MKRFTILTMLLVSTAATGTPAFAAKQRHARNPIATCQRIKDAVASGKSVAEVAKELKVTEARAKACSTARPHQTHKSRKHA